MSVCGIHYYCGGGGGGGGLTAGPSELRPPLWYFRWSCPQLQALIYVQHGEATSGGLKPDWASALASIKVLRNGTMSTSSLPVTSASLSGGPGPGSGHCTRTWSIVRFSPRESMQRACHSRASQIIYYWFSRHEVGGTGMAERESQSQDLFSAEWEGKGRKTTGRKQTEGQSFVRSWYLNRQRKVRPGTRLRGTGNLRALPSDNSLHQREKHLHTGPSSAPVLAPQRGVRHTSSLGRLAPELLEGRKRTFDPNWVGRSFGQSGYQIIVGYFNR